MSSKIILLDAAMGLLLIIPLVFLLHLAATLFIEAAILKRFGYKSFKKSLLDVFIVNIASMIVGLTWIDKFPAWGNFSKHLFIFSMLFAITLVIETGLLALLNRSFPIKKLLVASLIMNIITYAILILLYCLMMQL